MHRGVLHLCHAIDAGATALNRRRASFLGTGPLPSRAACSTDYRIGDDPVIARLASLVSISCLLGCDSGDVALLAPAPPGSPTRMISIRAVVDSAFASLADPLGWSAGIPGAQVRLHLMAEPYDSVYWRIAAADGSGEATFPDALAGLYEVEVTHALTSTEMMLAGGVVHLVAGGRRLRLPTTRIEEVTARPDNRGALVFSELAFANPPEYETGGIAYPDAKYFEVYNNADTTIYLDGKYWGIGWLWSKDYADFPCLQSEVVRNDPYGIWSEWIFRFPGSGSDHPVAPGQVAVVAQSAIDHRSILPTLPDLSQADFEWSSHIDNPDVPNLADVGLRPMQGITGPGPPTPVYLSEPVDLSGLPRYVDPRTGRVFVRIPASHILDARAGVTDFTTYNYEPLFPPCLQDLHASFERLSGPAASFSDFDQGLSIQRRVLHVRPDGRRVLQDTDTSMEDFVKAPRSPGWVPDSL